MSDATATVHAHERYALPLAFAADGERLYTGGFDGTVSVWDTDDWTEAVTVQAHEQNVNCGAITTDDRLVTGSTDTSLRVWSSDLADRVTSLDGHAKTVAGVASRPSTPLVASASYDTTVRVWNLANDVSPLVLEGHSGNVTEVAFVDESTLVSGGVGDEFVVWSLDSGAEVARVDGHGQAVSGLAARGETEVWSVGYNGRVRRWSTDDWTASTTVELAGAQKPSGIAVNQQTGDVAVTRDGGVVVLDSAGDSRQVHSAPIKGITDPLWSNDGETLYVGGADGKIRTYH
ncbi:WD40 repeat domain-containing protein [Salinirubrum litoreum]|uniref:WD40 repeat domain-containing protein n=1 Tax=Salinirubrum litoreum TaxID=1126234 RepID=A0ABD5R6P1_9EURY|nr:hypothetical protein [Salinirubrum litoreum]